VKCYAIYYSTLLKSFHFSVLNSQLVISEEIFKRELTGNWELEIVN